MVFSSPACVQEAEAWSIRMEGYGGPCRKGRWAPPVRMLKLTEWRSITSYKWVHPDDDDRR